MPFKLDNLLDLPRYVGRDTYQIILDDESGYDYLLLSLESRSFFGMQLGGWYFLYNTLPFGQLQIPPKQGAYANLANLDEHSLAAAKSAIFLITYFLIKQGYFLGVPKSILMPRKIVPYLGFLSDSSREVIHLIPEKKGKFLDRIDQTLASSIVSVKSLQRLVGKCVSFSLVVPGAAGSASVYHAHPDLSRYTGTEGGNPTLAFSVYVG